MRILIVEDEWLIAQGMLMELERLGHRVDEPATSVAEALYRIEHSRPDFAIIDTRLADGPSNRVVEVCRASGIPIIISSGHAPSELPDFAKGLPLLSKPYSAAELERMVLTATEGQL